MRGYRPSTYRQSTTNSGSTRMDNRTLLANLPVKLSQLGWGRLCGVNDRTAQRWFEKGVKEPVFVHTMLRFFVANPTMFKVFVKFVGASTKKGDCMT